MNDPQSSDPDSREEFDAIVDEYRRPRPWWRQAAEVVRDVAQAMWEQATDRYNPKWPPLWLRGSAIVLLFVVLIWVVLPLGAALVGVVGAGLGMAGDAGVDWLAGQRLAQLVTDPVGDYLAGHAPALDLPVSTAWWLWVILAAGFGLFGAIGVFGARLGWIGIGAATAAMVYVESPAGGAPLATGIAAAWWAVISILVLNRREKMLVTAEIPDRSPVAETLGQLLGLAPHRRFMHDGHKDGCDVLDSVADCLDGGAGRDSDRDSDAVDLARAIRAVREDVLGYRTYPQVPAVHQRLGKQWQRGLGRFITVDAAPEAGSLPVPGFIVTVLLDDLVDAQARQVVDNAAAAPPAGDRRVLHADEIGRVAAWLWVHDRDRATTVLCSLYHRVDAALVDLDGVDEVTIAEYCTDLGNVMPIGFDGAADLVDAVRQALRTASNG